MAKKKAQGNPLLAGVENYLIHCRTTKVVPSDREMIESILLSPRGHIIHFWEKTQNQPNLAIEVEHFLFMDALRKKFPFISP